MKTIFFEAVHNVIAHPLLTVGQILRLLVICIVIAIAAVYCLFTWKNILDTKFPEFVDRINPLIAAEKFHDWTADKM